MTACLRSAIAAALILAANAQDGDMAVPAKDNVFAPPAVPTCASFGPTWYFPNACPAACTQLGSAFDTDRSRNVNNEFKCYCVGIDEPYCTDSPRCSDLGIHPTSVSEDCSRVCGGDPRHKSKTAIDFNGYQFHYVVSCSCSDGTRVCGEESVLLSDSQYMNACTGFASSTKGISSSNDCDSFCEDTNVFTEGGNYTKSGNQHRCGCLSSNILTGLPDVTEAVVCDDATAKFNDGSGLGDPCYENVGINQIDCPDPELTSSAAAPKEKPSNAKTLVSSAAIFTGVWLLPL